MSTTFVLIMCTWMGLILFIAIRVHNMVVDILEQLRKANKR